MHGRIAGLSRSAYCRTRAAGGAKTLRDHAPVRQWMNDFAAAVGRWASEHDTLQAFIPPGQPWLGGFVESLHNRMRDELLEDNMFEDLNHARTLIGAWSRRYNEEHPHIALGWLSPNQYARQWAQHH